MLPQVTDFKRLSLLHTLLDVLGVVSVFSKFLHNVRSSIVHVPAQVITLKKVLASMDGGGPLESSFRPPVVGAFVWRGVPLTATIDDLEAKARISQQLRGAVLQFIDLRFPAHVVLDVFFCFGCRLLACAGPGVFWKRADLHLGFAFLCHCAV